MRSNEVEKVYRRVDFEDWDGDAPSNLDDPSIYGKAGETYRVRLLIGKDYVIEGEQPFDIVAKSDARIAVMEYGMNQAEVVWPVTFTVAEGRASRIPRRGCEIASRSQTWRRRSVFHRYIRILTF